MQETKKQLTPADILEIMLRLSIGVKARELAKKYHVSESTISRVRSANGQIYASIKRDLFPAYQKDNWTRLLAERNIPVIPQSPKDFVQKDSLAYCPGVPFPIMSPRDVRNASAFDKPKEETTFRIIPTPLPEEPREKTWDEMTSEEQEATWGDVPPFTTTPPPTQPEPPKKNLSYGEPGYDPNAPIIDENADLSDEEINERLNALLADLKK